MHTEDREDSSPQGAEQEKPTSAEKEVMDAKAGAASDNTGADESKEVDAAAKARERQERFKALRARAVSAPRPTPIAKFISQYDCFLGSS